MLKYNKNFKMRFVKIQCSTRELVNNASALLKQ